MLIHPEIKMQPGATVTAVWREAGKHLDLFATGTDGTVWNIWWEPGERWQYWKGWQPWFVIDPNMTVTEPSIKAFPGVHVAALWNGDHLDLFMTGADGAVWSTCWDSQPSPDWGLLANAGIEHQQMKGVFFFAGSSKDQRHEMNYTVRPLDERHLKWSEQRENRDFAIDKMVAAGVNVVLMSFWGERSSDRWDFWAPMQTDTVAHDQLFEAATSKNILIMPVIESGAATYPVGGHSPVFRLRDEFGADPAWPAPYLVYQIQDLVHRYLKEPVNPAWSRKWAQLYDRDGNKRYAIMLMHVAADKLAPDEHERFAVTFDLIANAVYAATGVRVGFTLDLLVPGQDACRYYYARAAETGPHLCQHAAVLAVQAFIPELSLGCPRLRPNPECDNKDENDLLIFKHDYLEGWIKQDLPVIFDASAGYFATIFGDPNPVKYGNNDSWRQSLGAMRLQLPVKGVSFHCWNGYTEGYAAVPSHEHRDANFRWLQSL